MQEKLKKFNATGASSKALFDVLVDGIAHIYASNEAKSIVYILLEHLQNLTKGDIINNKTLPIAMDYSSVFDRLLNHEPVQYITGEAYFYEHFFKVNNHTLIPRPETEELVDLAVKYLKSNSLTGFSSILDIGTGSGCIAISVAKALKTDQVTAFDCSESALMVANENAKILDANVDFILYDILKNKDQLFSKKFDLILSNPPYVMNAEKANMEPNVMYHEPSLALFVDDENPLIFYKAIAQFSLKNLHKKGKIIVEINERFGTETAFCFQEVGFSKTEILKDLHNKDRFVLAEI